MTDTIQFTRNFTKHEPVDDTLDLMAYKNPWSSKWTGSSTSADTADVEPVVDPDGGLWLCRETDNSCECIPW